jgi:hypothetical protein
MNHLLQVTMYKMSINPSRTHTHARACGHTDTQYVVQCLIAPPSILPQEWLSFLLCFREVPATNVFPDTGYGVKYYGVFWLWCQITRYSLSSTEVSANACLTLKGFYCYILPITLLCSALPSYTVPTATSFPVTQCPLPHPSQLHSAHCHILPSYTVSTATSFPVTRCPMPYPSQFHRAHCHILPSRLLSNNPNIPRHMYVC